MIETLVRQLSDGEELVIEGVAPRFASEDPRDRAVETRRQALDPSSFNESRH